MTSLNDRSRSAKRLVVIVPFQNEEELLPRLLSSIAAQTRPPELLVLLDDGSTDRSPRIAQEFAARTRYSRVLQLPARARSRDRLGEAAEFRAFQAVVESLEEPWDIVAKLDADLDLNPRHFETLVAALDEDERLGIVGAHLSDVGSGARPVRIPAPASSVRGATKFYRRECYDAIQPLPLHLGWDMIDDVKARMAGWKTFSVDLPGGDTVHLRPTGAHSGRLRAFARWGECAWRYGAHPLWILLGVAKRLSWQPYVLGGIFYGIGYGLAAARRLPRADNEVVRWVRREEADEVRKRLRWLTARPSRPADRE